MIDFTHTVLAWYATNKRDLPWRHTQDPYQIWLSEIILQQTRIQQGWSYWERFVERFPTVQVLAEASEDEVLRLWQGLGYYSRARNLHYAAKQIAKMGHFPDTIDEIKTLKGVGDYTAAAIGSMAFHLPVAVVDGNVYRVLARYYGIDTPINSSEGKKLFQELAQSLLPPSKAADFNQAMMDFGAIQCSPASPQCSSCPLMEGCEAFRSGKVSLFPVKLKTIKIKTRHFHYYYIRFQNQVAMRRRSEGDIWQGLWEPYLEEENENGWLLNHLKDQGLAFSMNTLRTNVKHILTHRIIMADFTLVETNKKPSLPDEYIWIQEKDIQDYAVPRLVEMLFESVNHQ